MPSRNRLLCVDDDMDDRQFLSEAIRDLAPHIQVVEVQNGVEALSYLEKTQDEVDLPFLIVLDINMPYMDGKQTLERIKKDYRLQNLPVKIYTSGANPNDKAFFNKQGVDMVVKPFNNSHLQEIVHDFLTFYR